MAADNQEIFLKRLGAGIRALRIKKGLRQEDFDDETEIGITSRGFQEIEYGRKNVKVYTLVKIAERMGMPLSELLGSIEAIDPKQASISHKVPNQR